MYEVLLTTKAKKQLHKLDEFLRNRIISSLERCRIRPQAHIKKLVGSPLFSLRVGDFRIILEIQKKKLIIYVLEMGPRKNIYSKIK